MAAFYCGVVRFCGSWYFVDNSQQYKRRSLIIRYIRREHIKCYFIIKKNLLAIHKFERYHCTMLNGCHGQSYFERIDQLCVNKGKDPIFFFFFKEMLFSRQNRYFLMLLANPLSRQKQWKLFILNIIPDMYLKKEKITNKNNA